MHVALNIRKFLPRYLVSHPRRCDHSLSLQCELRNSCTRLKVVQYNKSLIQWNISFSWDDSLWHWEYTFSALFVWASSVYSEGKLQSLRVTYSTVLKKAQQSCGWTVSWSYNRT
jgi:hypothetical protein